MEILIRLYLISAAIVAIGFTLDLRRTHLDDAARLKTYTDADRHGFKPSLRNKDLLIAVLLTVIPVVNTLLFMIALVCAALDASKPTFYKLERFLEKPLFPPK